MAELLCGLPLKIDESLADDALALTLKKRGLDGEVGELLISATFTSAVEAKEKVLDLYLIQKVMDTFYEAMGYVLSRRAYDFVETLRAEGA